MVLFLRDDVVLKDLVTQGDFRVFDVSPVMLLINKDEVHQGLGPRAFNG